MQPTEPGNNSSPRKRKKTAPVKVTEQAASTDRNSAEQLLLLNEERLRMATEATQLGAWDYKPLTGELYWSDACRKIYDVPGDVVIDYDFFYKHIFPDDRELAQSAIEKAMKGPSGDYDVQYRILRYTDHKIRWIRSQGKVYFDAHKQPELFIGTVLDITASKERELELLDSVTLFRTMADTVPVIIWMTDTDGRMTYFNKQWTSTTGLPAESARENDWTNNIHPEDLPEFLLRWAETVRDKREFSFTFRLRDQHDNYHWSLISGRPLMLRSGEAEGFIGSIVDIHEQKMAEESSARLAAIVHTSNDAIVSKTLDGIIRSWNPAAERLFGYSASEIIGQPVNTLIPPELIDEERMIIERLKKGEIVDHFNSTRMTKDGKLIDVALTISPIVNQQGNIIGASKIVRDITQQKYLDQSLLESEEKFRNLVMQAPVGIAIFRGKDYVVEMANETYMSVVDRLKDEFVGRPLFDSLPELQHIVQPVFDTVMETGEPYFGEEYPVTLNRFGREETVYFNFVYQPLSQAEGTISGIIVIATEVTKQVEEKHAIAERAREFSRMVTESPIAMTIWRGPDHIIEMANAEMFRNIWRKQKQDVIGRKALEVFPELNSQKYPELLRKVLQTGEVHREEESVAYVEGDDGMRKFYLDFEYAPLFETDGRVSGIIITVNNVTEKVEARHKVEVAESRLRMAAEGTGLATWDLDLKTRHIIYSPRLNEIFGHDHDAVLSHADMRAQIHPDDVHAIVEKAFDRALENGIYDYEARVIRPDGQTCWIRTQGRVIFDESKVPLRMLGTMRDITEQRNIQEAVAESENRLNIAVEAAELGTWELNLLRDEAKFSKRYLQIMGFEEHETPSHDEILKKIFPEDLPLRNAAMQRALQDGLLDVEMRIVPWKDNKIHWIKGRGKTFFNDKGMPIRMLGTIMDVTEQKNSLENLKESEERFKTIANTAPVMIWMSGNDKFSDFFNTSWLNFTGRKMEEEMGDGWLQNVHPEDVHSCVEVYNSSLSGHKPFYIEYRLRRRDGQYRWIADNAVPRYDAVGNFIGFISACMDIDDGKRFSQRLQASELLFKTISNVSPVGLWMTNEQGENTFVNDTWIRWTGTGVPESENSGGWVDSLLEADKGLMLRLFRSKSMNQEKFSAEFRFKMADGTVRWGLSEGFPYYDTQGNYVGYAGSVTDITERKQDELRKNEFLAVASHELKTPITSIKAYTQLLANTYDKTDDNFLKNALGKVENQVNKMSKLVGDFLNLSKIESDRFQLNREVFNMNDLVRETASDIQLVTVSHLITVQESTKANVNADREKIAQVLTNLLNNAIKYSPNEKEVDISVEVENDEVIVSIIDQGIGIRSDEHEKIFQRFYRAGSNNIQFSGFGIGLYISAEIIRKHAGQIGVSANEGKGSRFYFKLPLAN